MSPISSEAKSIGNITLLLSSVSSQFYSQKPLRIPREKVQIPHHFGPFKSGPIFEIAKENHFHLWTFVSPCCFLNVYYHDYGMLQWRFKWWPLKPFSFQCFQAPTS